MMKNTLRLLIILFTLTCILSLSVITASAQSSNIVHTVQIGETLSHIALRYGTTVEAISTLNNIPFPYWIYYGQQVVIPATGGPTPVQPVSTATVHIVQQGENLFRISLNYGWDVTTMAAVNGLVYPYLIYPGQQLVVPRQNLTHIVWDGETVASIAAQYGSSLTAIVTANSLANPNLIYAGQILIVP